ncbi:MAG: uroporphyrinogen decarboxylase [Bdellovibrio sp.]|nr:uroporphyrinogen decarboxylase [Bdellovibrio sp.]
MKTLFQQSLMRKNTGRPPVWFMRQAGRYHSHYQNLKKQYSFEDICTRPELACEATMGPIRDFDFDSAILFSDILFPLDVLGMGLSYPEGPELSWHLKTRQAVERLVPGDISKLEFQSQAIRLIRNALPQEKSLLGFVGGPWTLFCYAVEGSHQGNLISSKQGLVDGRFEGFWRILSPLLLENMVLQAKAGADAIAVLDTCAGELDPQTYQSHVIPPLRELFKNYSLRCPEVPLVYYGKTCGPDHWKSLTELPIAGLGIDWRHDLAQVLSEWGDRWAIQGNIDPTWLFLEPAELTKRLTQVFETVKALPVASRQGWICGLGHGVLPKTPESNVRLFIELQRKFFQGEGK